MCRGSGQLFTPLEALPQAWMMLVAGYETTAVTVATTVFCVSQHASVEAELLREVDSHSADAVPTQETLDRWPFAQVCARRDASWPFNPFVCTMPD